MLVAGSGIDREGLGEGSEGGRVPGGEVHRGVISILGADMTAASDDGPQARLRSQPAGECLGGEEV
jgi:hypothetical protein